MKAKDFIIQTRAELNEKTEFWKNEELLIKLQRSYNALQFDLPCFISKETLAIQKDKSQYYLQNKPIKNVGLKVDGMVFDYAEIENFYISLKQRQYTFQDDTLLLSQTPLKDGNAELVYKYIRELSNENCEIEIPLIYHKALRLLFMSEIHEKPTRNTKERVLSVHYIKLYDKEIHTLKVGQKLRPKNITSNYQRI